MNDLNHGIRIPLLESQRFGLRELFAAIGDRPLSTLSWKVKMDFLVIHFESEFARNAHHVAPLGDGIQEYRTDKRSWSFDELVRLSREDHQVVDGEFIGFKKTPKGKKRWNLITAFDSSFWEVWSGDEKLLSKVREAFQDTKDIGAGPAGSG